MTATGRKREMDLLGITFLVSKFFMIGFCALVILWRLKEPVEHSLDLDGQECPSPHKLLSTQDFFPH
jgi:hypothetical protein